VMGWLLTEWQHEFTNITIHLSFRTGSTKYSQIRQKGYIYAALQRV
jgi:hypothetical protein